MNLIAKLLMNSLYGRWAMSDNFKEINIVDESNYKSFENKNINKIISIDQLGKKYIVTLDKDYTDILLDNGSINHNVNVAIASAVTSYARIHMSQFKNNSDYKLFYSDTDSIYINKPLSSDLVSATELGKIKLEGIYEKGVFLAPKVYALKFGKSELLKIKGIKKDALSNIKFKDLEDLLIRDSKLEILQDKWFKSFDLGTITIKDQLYTLKVTSNKRTLVYNSNNILYNTHPFELDLVKFKYKFLFHVQ
jgi:DNA polymerase type B, organellar and viral